MNTATFPGIITNEQYENATELWKQAVNSPGSSALQESFTFNGRILPAVSFPVSQLISLVSTVGLYRVKAKFGLITDNAGQLRFTVILFAADSRNERISSYYANAAYWGSSAPSLPTVEVPNSLAQVWLNNWHEATQSAAPTSDMFMTRYGALEGYTFEAEDFIRPLFRQQSGVETSLMVRFGLHQYYQNTPEEDVAVRTFGLVLQLSSASQPAEPMFDISMPCPYTC